MKRWLRIRQLAWGFGRNSKPEAGYTITEVMIVLVVTMLMFAAIVVAFSGRQAGLEFSQSVRNYESALQNIMNEVSSGQYQSDFRCTLNGTGVPTINTSSPSDAGTNEACIFIGKVMTPAEPPNTSSTTDTLVGRRLVSNRDVETLAEARPILIPNANIEFNHSFGLQVRQVQNLNGNTRLYGLGFMNQFAQGSLPSGSDVSGGEGLIRLYGLTVPDLAPANGIIDPANLILLPEGAAICLQGQNGKYAEIVIGEGNSQNTITSVLDTEEGGERCSGL